MDEKQINQVLKEIMQRIDANRRVINNRNAPDDVIRDFLCENDGLSFAYETLVRVWRGLDVQ